MRDLPHFLRAPAPAPNRVRVTLTPPGGEPVSVWAERTAAGVTLAADVPGVAPGWAVAGRGLSGTVAAADGRAVEVSP